jgi:hypothetical protein
MNWKLLTLTALLPVLTCACLRAQTGNAGRGSVFFPRSLTDRVRENIRRDPWAASVQRQIVAAAQPWRRMSDERLWSLMFGSTITRSWMVWSNGHCPACKASVPMYAWEMDALKYPWKTRCPHCRALFPTNDFARFYRSGLDADGVFDPRRADRSLLYNAAHPDPKDPLHRFGVDDGEGYVEGEKRWRFIGAYLIYGQWKQAILEGVKRLAAAYTVTRDPVYAHKAGVLLHRIADLYPTMDFGKQGLVYEEKGRSGYVSTWHDACEETRELALAYDQVREAVGQDAKLADFLARKAKRRGGSAPKWSGAQVLQHIEAGILRDALANREKIYSNYPRTEIAILTILTVLDWRANREAVMTQLDAVIGKATAVDGVTGEKGLAGYSAYTIQGLAILLGQYSRIEPDFLPALFRRNPSLRQTWRFFIDTWCQQQYYPQTGDAGSFGARFPRYAGVILPAPDDLSLASALLPSMHAFLWQLYEITGDAAYVQALYHANGSRVQGLPYDLFAENPQALQRRVESVIAQHGAEIRPGSVNKTAWHLAILRGGEGANARALWLDYDSGGYHAHADGMNIGLFAKGLDLLPDFGYPPVQFGGWGSPRARWYTLTAAHNTVVVDGANHRSLAGSTAERAGYEGLPAGKTTLWADGKQFRAVRASGPEMVNGRQFERTLAMIDLSESDFYVLDLFRVVGGRDHARFLHSHFGTVSTFGLNPAPAPDYGYGAWMRRFQTDPSPAPGWSVVWKIEDRHRYLPPGSERHLRFTDLTEGAQASLAEAWIAPSGFTDTSEIWIPRVMTRRRVETGTLASAFVGVLEPYEKTPLVAQIRRLPLTSPGGALYPDACAAVELQLQDGRWDLLIAADAENPLALSPSLAADRLLIQKEWNVTLEGELCWVRRSASGAVERVALCRGRSVRIGATEIRLKRTAEFIEIRFDSGRAEIATGEADAVEQIIPGGD